MKRILTVVGQRLREWWVVINLPRHFKKLEDKAWQASPDYRSYLQAQLRRTLAKKKTPLLPRARSLIDKTAELIELTECDVLCIGCRNVSEIEYFYSKGAKNVVGIDLYSESEKIFVMDMHQMTFPDNSFDVLYSSHSLEHSYDVEKVAKEIVRVCRPGGIVVIEVPVGYETRGADLIDFGDCDKLHAVFAHHINRVLWCEEKGMARAIGNDISIIRTAFLLKKRGV